MLGEMIEQIRQEKLDWAKKQPDKGAWLDFYKRFFAYTEGQDHLEWVAKKRLNSQYGSLAIGESENFPA